MPDLIFATNNPHKAAEIQAAIGNVVRIITLQEAGIRIEIPEPHHTLQANASEKSRTIFTLTGKNCFSEDTGLEVDALHGKPGVFSARYAGSSATAAENMEKLLNGLSNTTNRLARFRTVISLLMEGKEYFFEGVCEGAITDSPRGNNGFGYDPVFIPSGSSKAFGEMTMEEKSRFSHRKKAADKLVSFLHQAAIDLQWVQYKSK